MFCGFWCSYPCLAYKLGPPLRRIFCWGKGGKTTNESTSSSLGSKNQVLKVRKSIVFDGKMGMRKFWSVVLPFSKVACRVKVIIILQPIQALITLIDQARNFRVVIALLGPLQPSAASLRLLLSILWPFLMLISPFQV